MCAFMYMADSARKTRRVSRGRRNARSRRNARRRRSRKGGDEQCPNVDCSWKDRTRRRHKTDICSNVKDKNGQRAPCGPCHFPKRIMEFLLYAEGRLAEADKREEKADEAKDSAEIAYAAAQARRRQVGAELVAAREAFHATAYKNKNARKVDQQEIEAKARADFQAIKVEGEHRERLKEARSVLKRAQREADEMEERREQVAIQKLGKCSSLSQQEQNVLSDQLRARDRQAPARGGRGTRQRRRRRSGRRSRRK